MHLSLYFAPSEAVPATYNTAAACLRFPYMRTVQNWIVMSYKDCSKNVSVAAWFDRRCDMYIQQGLSVKSSSDVMHTEFDVLVIAILNVSLAERIKNRKKLRIIFTSGNKEAFYFTNRIQAVD